MDRFNVFHIFHHYPPIISGYSKRSQEIVKNTASFAKSVVLTNPINIHKISKLEFNEKGAGEEIYRLRKSPLPPIRHIGHRAVAKIMLKSLLKKIFNEYPVDILHAHMPYLHSLPAIKMARKRKVKTIYEVRGIWEESAVAEGKINIFSPKYQRRKKNENKAMRLADKVVVLSNPLKKEIIKRGIPESKIILVPNAVDCGQFKPQPHSNRIEILYHLKGKVVLGYVGTLRKMEGLQNIIRLMPRILEKNPNVVLFVVGYGEYEPELKKMVRKYRLEKAVTFAGSIPSGMIDQYYSVMDVVLFPRLKLKVTEIVTPLKPLEAMAMGKCVLATGVGGLTEYCLDGINSIVVEPGDDEQMVRQIVELAANTDHRKNLEIEARKWVEENRNWSKVARIYEDLYNELCAAPKMKKVPLK